MAKNHPLVKDVKKWIVDSFSFMNAVGYDILFDDDIYGMENTKAISADIDGLTDFDFEKGKKNLLNSIPNKIKAEFPYLRITSGKDGHYFVMFIVLLDNNDYLEDKNIQYINLNESKESMKEKMDSKSEEIYDLLYRLFQLHLIQTSDYHEDRFDEITDYIEKNGVDKSYKNEAYKLAMRYINHDFSNGKEYKEIVKKFLDLFGLQVNIHSVEWNIISESKKSARKSIRESYDYDDIKDKTPIIDVWGNSEGTHVYEVFKINSDYVYYEYNYRKHDSTMIVDNNEIEVIIRLMDYLPTKFIVKQEDKIGMLESAIANIKAIDKHYGKLKKYNNNYYWQAVRFIKNSMLKDDDPDASNYFDEVDDVINDALEQNGDSFRV